MSAVEEDTPQMFPINYKDQARAHHNKETRQMSYEQSIQDSDRFWGDFARKSIDWIRPFNAISAGTFEKGDIGWFLNGQLNVSYNCVDRWVRYKPDETAIIFEGNEPGETQQISYKQLQEEVCKMANVLKRYGVRKGDTVVIYLPMIPLAAYAMLACARIGAPHSVIFAGFSQQAIRDRVQDANARFVITTNEGKRGGKRTPLKATVDRGLEECPDVSTVFVYQYTDAECPIVEGRDVNLNQELQNSRPYCPCEVMDSEDTLFLLYTSGSTGKPKGVLHTQAGYLAYTMATHKYTFDYQHGDVFACVADVGWITGHSYIVYGPLANGATTLMFESIPTYPDCGRYWDMIERHKITQFYTAPTAIRALMKFGEDPVKRYDLSSLKVLGTVGEPINPEAWLWYYNVVGDGKCPIVDTYWQTETGGHVLTPLPGATALKPGSATLPFFGIEPAILTKEGREIGLEEKDQEGVLVIKRPWPGIARTVYGDHQRYLNTYMNTYPGYYFTGDGAKRDADGYYWVTGRVDDVLNVSGHRLGSAEIESVVVEDVDVVESAVVGMPHEVKGQVPFVYAICREGVDGSDEVKERLIQHIRTKLGPFYTPGAVLFGRDLPKTRSGKIMRRILRKVAAGEFENLGDTSTLRDPAVVEELIQARRRMT